MAWLRLFKSSRPPEKKLESLSDKLDQILVSARSLFTHSENVKRLVNQEKSAVQKSSAAAHEISEMVGTTAEAAGELSHMARESHQAVEASVKTLQDLTTSVTDVDRASRELQNAVRTGLQEIASITETLSNVRGKTKFINEIVFKTSLLSFNASVEAARAGQHGLGFAVVAQEMGDLARASGDAAAEIEKILEESTERTQSQITAVTRNLEEAARATVRAIEAVASRSGDIAQAFSQLQRHAVTTEAKSRDISQATGEQRIGVREISGSLEDLATHSSELDRMAAESHRQSAELAQTVEEISGLFQEILHSMGFRIVPNDQPFDFRAAISAHVDWKMKLAKYLEKPDGTLDHAKVCLDNACVLGKWLHGPGAVHRATDGALFERLKSSHAEFHRVAGDVVRLINQRQSGEAEHLLRADGPYMKVSEDTVALIEKMRLAVESQKQDRAS